LNFSFLKKPWGNHFIFHFSFLKMGGPHVSFFIFEFRAGCLAGWLAVSLAGWLFGWISLDGGLAAG